MKQRGVFSAGANGSSGRALERADGPAAVRFLACAETGYITGSALEMAGGIF